MNRSLLILMLSLTISSCSLLTRKFSVETNLKSVFSGTKQKFRLTDKAGDFSVYREGNHKKRERTYITKREVYPFGDGKFKALEQSIAISKVGTLGNKRRIMRPSQSQYTVWFDARKYTTRMTVKEKEQSIEVRLKSPEKQWNGTKKYKFPNTRYLYCFYSQLLECAEITGFFSKINLKGKGQFSFYIIWDGYPYFQEQYLRVPNSIFTEAVLTYSGKNKNGEKRFSLSFRDQVIFFVFDKEGQFIKQYWVSQGMTILLSAN